MPESTLSPQLGEWEFCYSTLPLYKLQIFCTCIKQWCLLQRSYENTKIKTPKCDIHRSLWNSIINPFFSGHKKIDTFYFPHFYEASPQPCQYWRWTAFGGQSQWLPLFSLLLTNLMSDDHRIFRKLVFRCCNITVDPATPALFKVEHHNYFAFINRARNRMVLFLNCCLY